ncbi:hypothetical protein MA16_Dca027585 [Dendrobium catenatum]|uniref:Uncharacterized protein n=1 Tax=Dendrobium catenatum TaxID=906689 RepID=A0A2I0VBJ1_9ASPA|nr:hypothetical protein MA16_Dca027585 [Dendrobium catenatum]
MGVPITDLRRSHFVSLQRNGEIVDLGNEIDIGDEEENGVGVAGWAFPRLRRLCLRDLRSLRVFGVSFVFPFIESDACYGLPTNESAAFSEGDSYVFSLILYYKLGTKFIDTK